MYIRYRFDRKGNIIDSPENYSYSNIKELQEFLDSKYSIDNNNFDQNKSKKCG